MEAVEVCADDKAHVTAILVVHRPAYPSCACKFETEDRTVVISGVAALSGISREFARGVDVRVNDVISLA